MLQELAEGQTDPAVLAGLAEPELRATPKLLMDALAEAATMNPLHRQILRLFLERLNLIERQIETLKQSITGALLAHQDAVLRLAQVPGFGIDSAQQVIAEVGPQAAVFPSGAQLASWVGVCPGREESAEVSKNNRSPKGNRAMRRVLNQVAHAAVKAKGTVFRSLYWRLVPRLGHNKTIWAIAHRLCRLAWKILHQGVTYIEHGLPLDLKAHQRRLTKIIKQLRSQGYQIIPPVPQPQSLG
jgi:transposase